ncbi:DUF6351 family protein [Variovorax sp. J22R24]|uniref:DUF6351 family protein n=1 Tax=Variovorax gracilis TaxID=3053502 RepID=UPI002574ADF4|nr:DUF6351 family protein [Variovorax sp. J22R24]MDM0110273.1 DUF6351 family protein [Variovorax sp. J22R24]
MTSKGLAAAWAACVVLLASCGGGGSGETSGLGGGAATSSAKTSVGSDTAQQAKASNDREDDKENDNSVRLRVLSSAPEYVSGGDARIEVRASRGLRDKLELWLNGSRLNVTLADTAAGLEGVITGLKLGANTLEVRHRSGNGQPRDRLTLTNYPITGPIFTGPQQTPFVCTTIQGAVNKQPLVDSATPPGYPVLDGQGTLLGYSRDCSINTFVSYQYRSTTGALVPLPIDGSRPPDMAQATLADGRKVDFVVRREIGSINRFLYSIAMLAPMPGADNGTQSDTSLWNGKLLYWFQGGVAIGHSQGTVHGGSLNLDVLGRGWAIVHSSGNNTGTHYNMNLAGETALMTKERFIERYGVPIYTVGLGGSGGAIQQYMIAQNNPGVLDGLLPVQSYPDMVTQTIHVGDCELLEHYMDATDRTNGKWRVTKNRTWLVGMNAEENPDGGPNPRVNDALAPLKIALGYSTAKGSTECVPAWRGLTPLAMNPWYGQAPNQQLYVPQSDIAAIRWTHYDDLRNVYGVDATGAARPTWDNVGVQYGLKSLRAGHITMDEFVHLNWHVGGWKHPSDMVQEGFPFFGTTQAEINKALSQPGYFDPWSVRNMRLATADAPAPRTAGDPNAMRAAYTSGHVFTGSLDVPAIDHRQYMERELDMHNSHQSFAVRKRVLQKMGHSDNLVVWFTDTTPGTPKASQSMQALDVMDQWLSNIRRHPERSIAGNKPADAVDACFDLQGQQMSAGAGVWGGILDTRPAGACTQAFPLYGTSRTVAGAPIEGGIYRCTLKPVDKALADGTYGNAAPSPQQVEQLKRIFPGGVCDYTRPDQARPAADCSEHGKDHEVAAVDPRDSQRPDSTGRRCSG